jgi:YD repeat-containing protein
MNVTPQPAPAGKLRRILIAIGCAVGDALGLHREGLSARRAAKMFPDPDRYYFLGRYGTTSDDYDHASMTVEALCAAGGDPTSWMMFNYDAAYPRLSLLGRDNYWLAFGCVPAGQPGAGSLASIAGGFPIFYTNDVLGRVQSSQAGSSYFKVQYDELGRVYWSSNNQGVTTAAYDDASERVKPLSRPNGITTVYGYTAVTNGCRLQFIWHTNQAGTTLARYDYGRDVLGRITLLTNTVNGATTNWAYKYDPAGQLLSATASTSSGTVVQRYHYGYDAGGNRISQQAGTSATAEQVNGLNQLTNRAGTGGVVWVAGYLSETGTVIVAGAPARMTTTTNFEGEVYALAATNVVTVVAIDLNGNAATNSRTFTIASNGSFGSLTYDLNGNLLKKTPAWTSSGTSLTTAFTSATAPATPA